MIENLKKASLKLLNEKNRSEAIINAIPEAIMVSDNENRLIFANQKAEKAFNFSLKEIKNKFIENYINHEKLLKILQDKKKTDSRILE